MGRRWIGVPSCTVAMPVAVVHEPLQGVLHALDVLSTSCAAVAPAEVVVWCNAARMPGEVDIARRRFDLLVEAVRTRGYRTRGVRVRPMLDLLTTGTNLQPVGVLKVLRANYMAAIIRDALSRGLTMEHPVLWFDADTTFMSPDTVGMMIDVLARRSAHFVKGNMQFTGEPWDARPYGRLEPAEKVAAIYAVARAMLEEGSGQYEPRAYADECGFGLRLCDYQSVGGLSPPVFGALNGESRELLGNARTVLDPAIPLVAYLKEARHGTSWRRIHSLARREPASEIPDRDAGDLYEPHFVQHAGSNTDRPITEAEVFAMVSRMVRPRTVSRYQLSTLIDLVTGSGFGQPSKSAREAFTSAVSGAPSSV